MDEVNKFEITAMNALTAAQEGLIPEHMKDELRDWELKILAMASNELETLITESADYSFQEEALAREFVKRGIDVSKFLEAAKFRTTKAILRGEM